jgi:hypothetical protein
VSPPPRETCRDQAPLPPARCVRRHAWRRAGSHRPTRPESQQTGPRADLSGDGGAGQLRTGQHRPRAAPVSSVLQLQAEGPSAADTDEYPAFRWGHERRRQRTGLAGRRLGLAASRCARNVPGRRSRWVRGSRARSRRRRGASAPDQGARQQRTERDEPRRLTLHALMTPGLQSWLRQQADHAVTASSHSRSSLSATLQRVAIPHPGSLTHDDCTTPASQRNGPECLR